MKLSCFLIYQKPSLHYFYYNFLLKLKPLDTFGSPLGIVGLFGGKMGYLKALGGLECEIYRSVA
jgi:hypothetical protein